MVPCRWEDRPQVWEEVFAARVWFHRHTTFLRLSSSSVLDRARDTMIELVFQQHSQPRRTA